MGESFVPADLPARHQEALRWFERMAGRVTTWPDPFDGVGPLASRPKGIYKPEWSSYALSVRETLDGPYADREPIAVDGSWLYAYHQEGPSDEGPTDRWMNAALYRCLRDGVPVGVFREIPSSRRRKSYAILVLATPIEYDVGFFFLEGGSSSRPSRVSERVSEETSAWDADLDALATATGLRLETARRLARPKQSVFRKALLTAYRATCAATQFDVPTSLQAAHIAPLHQSDSNAVSNGLLLRADIHLLFDNHLLRVLPDRYMMELRPDLLQSQYASLDGVALWTPSEPEFAPDRALLAEHAASCGW